MGNPSTATSATFTLTEPVINPPSGVTKANLISQIQILQNSLTTLQNTISALSSQVIGLSSTGGLDLDGNYQKITTWVAEINHMNIKVPIMTNQLTIPS